MPALRSLAGQPEPAPAPTPTSASSQPFARQPLPRPMPRRRTAPPKPVTQTGTANPPPALASAAEPDLRGRLHYEPIPVLDRSNGLILSVTQLSRDPVLYVTAKHYFQGKNPVQIREALRRAGIDPAKFEFFTPNTDGPGGDAVFLVETGRLNQAFTPVPASINCQTGVPTRVPATRGESCLSPRV